MNISLVLTGLATCGGLLFAGIDLGWNDDGCSDEERDLGVHVDVGRHAGASRTSAVGGSSYSHDSACDEDGP